MSKRTHLQDAKDRKDDEFYTRFDDIENRNLNINLDKAVTTNGSL